MSVGKSSIARAVNTTATKTQTVTSGNAITKFSLDSIGVLTVAQAPENIEDVKSSISKRGILCPVLVATTPKGDVWLLDGYRRYFAAKELKISEICASVINVENKSEANRIYTELSKLKPVAKTQDIHEEKFRVLCVKDHDLPSYLL